MTPPITVYYYCEEAPLTFDSARNLHHNAHPEADVTANVGVSIAPRAGERVTVHFDSPEGERFDWSLSLAKETHYLLVAPNVTSTPGYSVSQFSTLAQLKERQKPICTPTTVIDATAESAPTSPPKPVATFDDGAQRRAALEEMARDIVERKRAARRADLEEMAKDIVERKKGVPKKIEWPAELQFLAKPPYHELTPAQRNDIMGQFAKKGDAGFSRLLADTYLRTARKGKPPTTTQPALPESAPPLTAAAKTSAKTGGANPQIIQLEKEWQAFKTKWPEPTEQNLAQKERELMTVATQAAAITTLEADDPKLYGEIQGLIRETMKKTGNAATIIEMNRKKIEEAWAAAAGTHSLNQLQRYYVAANEAFQKWIETAVVLYGPEFEKAEDPQRLRADYAIADEKVKALRARIEKPDSSAQPQAPLNAIDSLLEGVQHDLDEKIDTHYRTISAKLTEAKEEMALREWTTTGKGVLEAEISEAERLIKVTQASSPYTLSTMHATTIVESLRANLAAVDAAISADSISQAINLLLEMQSTIQTASSKPNEEAFFSELTGRIQALADHLDREYGNQGEWPEKIGEGIQQVSGNFPVDEIKQRINPLQTTAHQILATIASGQTEKPPQQREIEAELDKISERVDGLVHSTSDSQVATYLPYHQWMTRYNETATDVAELKRKMKFAKAPPPLQIRFNSLEPRLEQAKNTKVTDTQRHFVSNVDQFTNQLETLGNSKSEKRQEILQQVKKGIDSLRGEVENEFGPDKAKWPTEKYDIDKRIDTLAQLMGEENKSEAATTDTYDRLKKDYDQANEDFGAVIYDLKNVDSAQDDQKQVLTELANRFQQLSNRLSQISNLSGLEQAELDRLEEKKSRIIASLFSTLSKKYGEIPAQQAANALLDGGSNGQTFQAIQARIKMGYDHIHEIDQLFRKRGLQESDADPSYDSTLPTFILQVSLTPAAKLPPGQVTHSSANNETVTTTLAELQTVRGDIRFTSIYIDFNTKLTDAEIEKHKSEIQRLFSLIEEKPEIQILAFRRNELGPNVYEFPVVADLGTGSEGKKLIKSIAKLYQTGRRR